MPQEIANYQILQVQDWCERKILAADIAIQSHDAARRETGAVNNCSANSRTASKRRDTSVWTIVSKLANRFVLPQLVSLSNLFCRSSKQPMSLPSPACMSSDDCPPSSTGFDGEVTPLLAQSLPENEVGVYVTSATSSAIVKRRIAVCRAAPLSSQTNRLDIQEFSDVEEDRNPSPSAAAGRMLSSPKIIALTDVRKQGRERASPAPAPGTREEASGLVSTSEVTVAGVTAAFDANATLQVRPGATPPSGPHADAVTLVAATRSAIFAANAGTSDANAAVPLHILHTSTEHVVVADMSPRSDTLIGTALQASTNPSPATDSVSTDAAAAGRELLVPVPCVTSSAASATVPDALSATVSDALKDDDYWLHMADLVDGEAPSPPVAPLSSRVQPSRLSVSGESPHKDDDYWEGLVTYARAAVVDPSTLLRPMSGAGSPSRKSGGSSVTPPSPLMPDPLAAGADVHAGIDLRRRLFSDNQSWMLAK